MNNENSDLALHRAQTKHVLSARVSSLALASITPQTQGLLLRMFADPYLLEKQDKITLIEQLRECVSRYPQVSELRVLLGMALCVNLDVHPAIDELKESVKLASRSNLDEGLRREVDLFALCFSSADKNEGVNAFLEKRKPDFKGR